MNLPCKEQFNGKPTFFIEKIWAGLDDFQRSFKFDYEKDYKKKFGKEWDKPDNVLPKIHTIRKGLGWKEGMLIDFWVNARTKNMFRFAPKIEVQSIQTFKLEYYSNFDLFRIKIDGVTVFDGGKTDNVWSLDELEKFCQNDGFASSDDFLEWFDKDFGGKIIHWTGLVY
jgi:hypothetical protein